MCPKMQKTLKFSSLKSGTVLPGHILHLSWNGKKCIYKNVYQFADDNSVVCTTVIQRNHMVLEYLQICPHLPTPQPPTPTHGGSPTPTTHSHPWGSPRSVKIQYILNKSRYFNSVWRFEICGGSPTYGWVYSVMGGCLYGWVDGWHHVESLKI